ncbi:MAG TPA: hypothetical protein VNO26_14745 [Candidatus Limnocylindria bacterium]|nr:hypothetical protein [Candidatus Limnocylindria bacterium]
MTVDPQSGDVTVVGSPGDWFEHPVPTAEGMYVVAQNAVCAERRGVFRLDPGDQRPALVEALALSGASALARHPGDGLLYRLEPDGLFVTDPLTGTTSPLPAAVPTWFEASAMVWAPACNALLVADGFDGLWILDPVTGSVEPSSSTSTSSSTLTTLLPSEFVAGRRLVLTDGPKPKKRRFALRSGDPVITLGGGEGSGDDPVLHGGSLRVAAKSRAFQATYPLAADGWRYVRKAGRVVGYAWRGAGAIRKVVLRESRLEVRGQGASLERSLFTDPGAVQVVLQLGGRRWCLEFGGTFDARTARKLRARDAPAPAVCAAP